jgi:hypothetical protein
MRTPYGRRIPPVFLGIGPTADEIWFYCPRICIKIIYYKSLRIAGLRNPLRRKEDATLVILMGLYAVSLKLVSLF